MNQQPRVSKATNNRVSKAMNQQPRVLKAMNQQLRDENVKVWSNRGHGGHGSDGFRGGSVVVVILLDVMTESVITVVPPPTSTPSGYATPNSDSHDALSTQLSELVQQLHTTLTSSSIATLVDSSNVCMCAPFNPHPSQLTKVLQCSIAFDLISCIFQDLKTKKMISLGHEKDGLCYLDLDGSFSFTFSSLSATLSPLQWNFCLGHPSLAIPKGRGKRRSGPLLKASVSLRGLECTINYDAHKEGMGCRGGQTIGLRSIQNEDANDFVECQRVEYCMEASYCEEYAQRLEGRYYLPPESENSGDGSVRGKESLEESIWRLGYARCGWHC
uniref:Uncharacterized protein n=1 Tax=Fagus sylvatica TaxID=28930 RepID=A0A2N9HJQ0_FAGSY